MPMLIFSLSILGAAGYPKNLAALGLGDPPNGLNQLKITFIDSELKNPANQYPE